MFPNRGSNTRTAEMFRCVIFMTNQSTRVHIESSHLSMSPKDTSRFLATCLKPKRDVFVTEWRFSLNIKAGDH